MPERRTPYRAPKKRPQSPPAKRRAARTPPTDQRRQLLTLAGLVCLALVICLVVGLVSCNAGPKAPAEPDYGESAGAWQKNDKGFYFNDAGEVIPGAVLKGIDVSKYQGEVDWEKAKTAGIDFAILRCGFGNEWNGEGNYNQDDSQWRRNADECTRLGIPFGCYLYSYAVSEEDARREADHVARLLGLTAPPYEGLEDYTAAPYQLEFPVYYDLEDKSIAGLLPDEMAALVTAFFDQLESYGYQGRQGLYASLNWVRARFDDAAFDEWRDELWIARFASRLGYTGPYRMWQCSYTAPGADYGVQSETVDIDFVMRSLSFTGIEDAKGKQAPSFTNDTYKDELWLSQKKDAARLVTDQPAEENGGQKLFWESSDTSVAKVNKKGVVTAVGEGGCTVTATLADGTESAEVTVRVGSVTVPVFATGALNGQTGNDGISLADIAALKAGTEDAILVDTGASVHGTASTSLTGGVNMTGALGAAGYDIQVFDASDMAFGVARLLSDINSASGSTLAANLRAADGAPLFYRSTSWNRNRVSNGMNTVLKEAGKQIGFFALSSSDAVNGWVNVPREDTPFANEMVQTASEQTAALRAKGVDAVVCLLGADCIPDDALLKELKNLGVDAVICGGLAAGETPAKPPLPVLGAKTGLDSVAKLELTFAADGSVSAACSMVSAGAMASARGSLSDKAQAAYNSADSKLKDQAESDASVLTNTLFTLEKNTYVSYGATRTRQTISFGNYVAQVYENIAASDVGEPVKAVVSGVQELAYGDVTRGDLQNALPGPAQRIQLVRTTGEAVQKLLDNGGVQTYLESLTAWDTAGEVLLVTDTAALTLLGEGDYTLVRDYGDVYWNLRMVLLDDAGGEGGSLCLPETPNLGAGRTS